MNDTDRSLKVRRVTKTAYAKINLSLDVLGRRKDGYHLIKMIMQTIDLSDTLVFETEDRETESMEITLRTDNPLIPSGEDNLICRAIRAMAEEYKVRRDITVTLDKRIPVAAGIAGGSTDAAAAMRAFRDLFVPDVTNADLRRIALPLGADIPYCIEGGTRLSEGIGEALTVLPDAPQCALVIAKPAAGVSTAEIYHAYDALTDVRHPDIDAQIRAIRDGDLPGMAVQCINVLEEVTGAMYPQIGRMESWFMENGALASRMSGSGPTVFAIYNAPGPAERAVAECIKDPAFAGCEVYLSRFVYSERASE